jgi:hypothetical protein
VSLCRFAQSFVSRFQNRDSDPEFWRVENRTIVGESTPEKVARSMLVVCKSEAE